MWHFPCSRVALPLLLLARRRFAPDLIIVSTGFDAHRDDAPDLSGFLRGDPETRWAANKIAIETGVLDPEEVRQVEGWNPRRANSPAT